MLRFFEKKLLVDVKAKYLFLADCWRSERVEEPELKTLECDILNPDLLTFLEIKFMRRTSHI